MKKVGIVTLDGMFNYGNRLQNYAMEKVLNQIGFDSQTLVIIDSKKKDIWSRIRNKISNPKDIFPALRRKTIKEKKITSEMASFIKMRDLKTKEFSVFQNKYLNNVKVTKNANFNEFFKIIVGSDQVWNPRIGFNTKNFLVFVPKEKRISYAASFGVSNIPKPLQKHYTKHLMGINEISVREEAGKEIIRQLTGRTAELVFDPTMLLKREDWEKLIPVEEYHAKPYIIIYALRGYNEEKKQKLNKFAVENEFEIIHIMGDFYNEKHKVLSPDEFLHALRDARMIFTDSFHCIVFSIIMHKPFVIFERSGGNMGSRIETLLSRFNLTNNLYTSKIDFDDVMINTDFNDVDLILEKGRNHGIQYLKRVLEVN